MSQLTAEGRKRTRDIRLDGVNRTLRLDKSLNGLSRYQRGTLAELKLIGRDLYADIRHRGVILPTGEVNLAAEAHRKNAHEQLYSLSVFSELNRTQCAEPADIVAMASAGETETVEPADKPAKPPSE